MKTSKLFFLFFSGLFILIAGMVYSQPMAIDTNTLTNVETVEVEETRLPNRYLKTQETNQPEPISFARRYDAVFFIAVPATYYIMFNILQQKNWYLKKTFTLDTTDETFLYLTTIFLPLIVAYVDYLYVENYGSKATKLIDFRSYMSLCNFNRNENSVLLPVLNFYF